MKEIDKKYLVNYVGKILREFVKNILKDPKSYILNTSSDQNENSEKIQIKLCNICDSILSSLEKNIKEIPL